MGLVVYSCRPDNAHNRLASGETQLFAAADGGASRPPAVYRKPLACNCLVYLQDMNDLTGQFRIAKGSHLDASPVPDADAMGQPLPNEELANIEAGDLLCKSVGGRFRCRSLQCRCTNVQDDTALCENHPDPGSSSFDFRRDAR
jgi:hypothetical protein